MSSEQRDPQDERLDALFVAYKMACEPREVSPNFMPELWKKIDRAQSATFSFRKIARGFVTAAAALSMLLASVAYLPELRPVSPVYSATYVEVLAAHSDDAVDVARPDLSDLSEVSEVI
jgi:hypothetical protein